MALLRALFGSPQERRGEDVYGGLSGRPIDSFMKAIGGGPSKAGVPINARSHESIVAAHACVNRIAQTAAWLPYRLMRWADDRKSKIAATEHPLFEVLHGLSNPEMTAYDVREILTGHLASRGRAFAEIVRDRQNRVCALWPLRPDRMRVTRTASGTKLFVYTLPNGETKRWIFDANNPPILHLMTNSLDGLDGRSPITMHRDTLGLSKAAEEYGARFFSNGSKPGGVLQAPKGAKLDDLALGRMKNDWELVNRGLDNAHRIAILEEGITWHQVGFSPQDSQFLDTRRFQTEEVCRIWLMQPHMIGHTTPTTSWGTGIEQLTQSFLGITMMPWFTRWQQCVRRDCLGPREYQNYDTVFVYNAFVRGDLRTRTESYARAIDRGWLCPDEVREMEGLGPRPDGLGGVYLQQLNMVPAGMLPALIEDPPNGSGGTNGLSGDVTGQVM